MLLYVQQASKEINPGERTAFVDFASLDDHLQLRNSTRVDQTASRRRDQASMARITYVGKGHAGLKEGSWYDVPLENFQGFRYEEHSRNDAGSTFLRGTFSAPNRAIEFSQFLAPPKYANLTPAIPTFAAPDLNQERIEVQVVDCGHGNWNEVSFGQLRLLYDAGACRSFKSSQVRALVRSRSIASDKRRIYLFISHWDVDHYQALLRFSAAELANIKGIYVPSQVPDTATYKSVRSRLDKYGVPIHSVNPAQKVPSDKNKVIDLKQIATNGPIRIFRATPGRSRNQTGIVLGIQGSQRIAMLTGDHHYEKLLKVASSAYGSHKKPLLLVAPHHGGHAGVPVAKDWLAVFSSIDAPISCGSNNWDHPYKEVTDELTLMQRGKSPRMTKASGTLKFHV